MTKNSPMANLSEDNERSAAFPDFGSSDSNSHARNRAPSSPSPSPRGPPGSGARDSPAPPGTTGCAAQDDASAVHIARAVIHEAQRGERGERRSEPRRRVSAREERARCGTRADEDA